MHAMRGTRYALMLAGLLLASGCAADSAGESERVARCQEIRAQNEPLADLGDADAAFQMAELYNVGCAVPHRPGYAYLNYKMAAERGHGRAALRLAGFYTGSSVVGTDWPEGLFWMAVAERDPSLTARERQSIASAQRLFLNTRIEGNGSAVLRQAEQRAASWTPRQD